MVPYKPIYGVGVKWERVDDEYMVSMSDAILLPVSPLTSPALPAPPTNDSDHAKCRGVFIRLRRQCFCLVRARVYRNRFWPILVLFGSCIFSIGPNRDFSKSNNVRTGHVRSTKLSGIVRLGDPYQQARLGVTPPTGFAARGR